MEKAYWTYNKKCEMHPDELVSGSAQLQPCCQTLKALSATTTAASSKNILPERTMSEPIKFKRERSISENQLFEFEQETDYRDYCMYLRIAGGMLLRCKDDVDSGLVDSIIRTRHSFNTTTSDFYILDDEDDNDVADITAPSLTPPLSSNLPFTTSSRRRTANDSCEFFLSNSPTTLYYYTETYGVVDDDSSLEGEIFELDF